MINKVKEAIYFYNKYRSPEAKAKLLTYDHPYVMIAFEGSFTCTCGINDWVEDFVYLSEAIGLRVELVRIEESESSNDYLRVGLFKVLGTVEKRNPKPSKTANT